MLIILLPSLVLCLRFFIKRKSFLGVFFVCLETIVTETKALGKAAGILFSEAFCSR